MSITSLDGVLIVGGGYAGVHAARAVRHKGRRATIVDPTGRHDFVPRLAAVAGRTSPTSDASAPLEFFADDVIVGSMDSCIDGIVTLDDGTRLGADALVVTAGSRTVRPPIDGIEFARHLRTAADSLSLRSEIDDADAVVVIGGGPTGVQLAGAVAATSPDKKITVVEATTTLLAGMGASTGHDAGRILRERGVDVIVGESVDSIRHDGVSIGDRIIDGLPVWAAGFEARADDFGFPTDEEGRIVVAPSLLVDGWSTTFAAGDIAAHRAGDGSILPMSAQIAVQAGEAAGRNAVRRLDGLPVSDASLTHRGWVLDLGGRRGLAEFGPVSLTAPVLDLLPPLLHWGIDTKHLVETRGLRGFAERLPI